MPGGIARFGAWVVAGSVLLAGCASGSAGPVVLPSRTASAAPTAERTAASPFPRTAAGAAAFARHFLAALDTAYLTGDPTALEALVRPECGSCARMLSAIRRTYGAGGRFTGGRTTVTFAEAPAMAGDRTTVDVVYRYEAMQVLDRAGRVVSTESARTTEAALDVLATASGWVVTGYRRVR